MSAPTANPTRQDNIETFISDKEMFDEVGDYGDYYASVVEEMNLKGRSDAEVAAKLTQAREEVWEVVNNDLADEAYQQDIDSGWAAERAALDRAYSASW